MLMISMSLFAAGNKEAGTAQAYGPGFGRGPVDCGYYQANGEDLPEPEEVTLKGTFSYKEGIPFLTAGGKDYHVTASAYAIAETGIVKENDEVTVEGLLFPAFDEAPFESEGNLVPQKVTNGNQTYILPAQGPMGGGRGPRGGMQGGARGMGGRGFAPRNGFAPQNQ